MIGKQLGHYEILDRIGAGGMGEVYRARDTRLDRTVAVKVLSQQLSSQAELRERFEREARTISSLNHPNICTLFDVGRQEGTDFLVMEYLDGETLADRLDKGPMPLDDALKCAIEIADALDKAHRQGIVHRDLKPGNIMLTKTGAKLLDFGLAKLRTDVSGAGKEGLSTLPTNAALTAHGAVLGTLQYMSPEQLEGQDADARTDIFGFGSVLYQMVTGQRAFQGKSQVTLISAIVSSDPAKPSTLRTETPPILDHVITRCLAKDPDRRWQSAGDIVHELTWIRDHKNAASVSISTDKAAKAPRLWIGLTAVLAAALVVAIFLYLRIPVPESNPIRLAVVPPNDWAFVATSGGSPWPALSPDGRRMIFGAVSKDGKSMLFMRPLDSEKPQPIAGTEGGQQPFWSPDSRYIAFFAEGKLKKIDTAGGAAQTICPAAGNVREGAWAPDDSIIFATSNNPLSRVPAAGGQPQPLTELDKSRRDAGHLYPQFLPDGRHFVFLAQGADPAKSSIAVGSLDSKEIKYLVDVNSKARYAAPGYLLYVREAALVAQSFDAKRLQISGDPFPVVDNIRHTITSGIAAFSTAADGTLAYITGEESEGTQFVWFDRSGKEIDKVGAPGLYANLELSPDAKYVAVDKGTDDGSDVWLLELARGLFTRFTSEPGAELGPLWSAGGSRLLYASRSNLGIVEKAVNGTVAVNLLLKGGGMPQDVAPDGKSLLYFGGRSLSVLPLAGDRTPRALSETQFIQTEGRFSPDGRWIVYSSNESGRFEVYARNFPSNENKIQISTNGGSKPRWSRDGKEIFYIANDERLMAVSVSGDKQLSVRSPEPLFPTSTRIGAAMLGGLRQQYDVSADGKRFLFLNKVQTQTPPPVTLFAHWQTKLAPGPKK